MRKIKHGLFSQLLLISSIILLVLAAAYGVTRQYVRRTSRSSVLELNEKALTQIQKSAQDESCGDNTGVFAYCLPVFYDGFGGESDIGRRSFDGLFEYDAFG